MTEMLQETEKFVDDATWLTAADQPAVAMLRLIARNIDQGDASPALLAQYGLCYRSLLRRQPQGETVDPLAAALEEAES